MATVPMDDTPQPMAAPRPVYQDPAAPAAAFGAAQAQSLEKAGPQLQQASDDLGNIALQQAKMTSAVDRGNALHAFMNGPAPGTQPQDGITNDPTSSLANANLTDGPQGAAANQYRNSLEQQIQTAVAADAQKNGPLSAAMLNQTLRAKQSQFVAQANSMAQGAAVASVTSAMGSELNPIFAQASMGTGNFSDQVNLVHGAVARYADALPGGAKGPVAANANNAALQKLGEVTLNGMFARAGDQTSYDNIQNFLTQNASILGVGDGSVVPDAMAKLAAGRTELAKYNMLHGPLGGPDSPNNFLVNNAAAFGAGMLNEQQDAQYIAAAQGLARTSTRLNPTTGLPETVAGMDLSQQPLIAKAFRDRNLPIPGTAPLGPQGAQVFNPTSMQWEAAPAQAAPPANVSALAGTPQAAAAGPLPAGSPQAAAAASPPLAQVVAPGPAPAPAAPPPGDTFAGKPTLFSAIQSVNGPVNATLRGLNAVVPGGIAVGDAATMAATQVKTVGSALVSALSDANLAGGLRASPDETKQLSQQLEDLGPNFVGTQRQLTDKMRQLDDSLAQRQAVLTARVNDPGEVVQVRNQAKQLVAQIQGVRNTMGMPPQVSLEEGRQMAADPANNQRMIETPGGQFVRLRYTPLPAGGK